MRHRWPDGCAAAMGRASGGRRRGGVVVEDAGLETDVDAQQGRLEPDVVGGDGLHAEEGGQSGAVLAREEGEGDRVAEGGAEIGVDVGEQEVDVGLGEGVEAGGLGV